MKHTLRVSIFCVALLCCNRLSAQAPYYAILPFRPPTFDTFVNTPGVSISQIVDTLYSLIDPTDTVEGGAVAKWSEFKKFWEGRAGTNDGSGQNMFTRYYAALRATILAGRGACGSSGYQGAWESIGPDNMPTQTAGYVNTVWVDIADSNYILAGTPGGLFKTINGGANWECITDNAPLAVGIWGVSSVAVNPRNTNTIYLGTSNNTSTARGGAGILLSYDAGNTWVQKFIPASGTYTYEDSIQDTHHVFITPDSTLLYAFLGSRVYLTSTNPSLYSWTDITPPGAMAGCGWNDLRFDPADQNHFFISSYGDGGKTAIWEATDATGSGGWTKVTNGFDDPSLGGYYTSPTGWSIMDMSVPGNDTLYFIGMDSFSSCYQPPYICPVAGLYKCNLIGTRTITKLKDNLPYDRNPNGSHFKLIVSPQNPQIMYYASDIPYQSYGWDRTFYPIGEYSGATHADIRDLYLQKSTNTTRGSGDRLFVANDGGVSKKPSGVDISGHGDHTTKDISGKGLICGTFWSFATSEAEGEGMGGMMHDGIVTYEPGLPQKWANLGVSDAWSCVVDNEPFTKGYGWYTSNELNTTSSAGGRDLGVMAYFPRPADPGFDGIGKSLAINQFGTLYCGGNDIWRKDLSSGSWGNISLISGFGSFPHTLGTGTPYYAAEIVISPYDTGFNGYVHYNTNASPTKQYIYYRNGSNPTYVTALQVNVPPGTHFDTFSINCLATDAYNTENVWAAIGGVNLNNYAGGSRNRVQYSPDHATTWIDISSGLPQRMPVTNIVYDEVAKMLYCGTDAGIYKYDFGGYVPGSTFTNSAGNLENSSVSWTCFSTGKHAGHDFPNAMVTALQINHCEGKLYAATFGRSIWSTDLNPPGAVVGTTTTITSSTSWNIGNHNWYLNGSIHVLAGVTLTISNGDTVHMPRGGAIIVEPGGRLIVRKAKITNSCDGCFWEGIKAGGNSSLPQTPANQAWVKIENGSTIEHAMMAVSNYTGFAAAGNSGGIIQATSSYFINNRNSATFTVYRSVSAGGATLPDRSDFINCTFLLDNNYKGNATGSPAFYNHVSLYGVDGVGFGGCQFLNRDTVAAFRVRGEGLYAMDASFNVVACCTPGTYCAFPSIYPRFAGFTNGISVATGSMGAILTSTIDQARFDTVSVGVSIAATNNVSTTRSHFKVGHGRGLMGAVPSGTFSGCYQNIGILLRNSEQFKMEGNTFEGIVPMGDWYNFGTVVDKSGETSNIIYRNVFDSLQHGVFAVGHNRPTSSPLSQGLKVLCNTFRHNDVDIAATTDGTTSTIQGIAAMQGTWTGVTGPAGNTFIAGGTDMINNTPVPGGYFDYFYGTGSGEFPSVPAGSPNMTRVATGTAATCQAGYDPYGTTAHESVPLPSLAVHKGKFRDYKTTLQDSLTLYYNVLDFGNTDSLIVVIDTCLDTTLLYSILSGGSPYISVTALKAVVDYVRLPHYSMMQLLLQNADALKGNDFMQYVETAYSLSGGEMEALADAMHVVTRRTEHESHLAGIAGIIDYEANIIIMALKSPLNIDLSPSDTTGDNICLDSTSVFYMQDSNAYYVGLDSLDTWYKNIGGIWTMYERVGYYHYVNNMTVADSIFDGIASVLSGYAPEEGDIYDIYTALWTVIKSSEDDGRNVYNLSPSETTSLGVVPTDVFGLPKPQRMIIRVTGLHDPIGPVGREPCIIFSTDGGKYGQTQDGDQPPITAANGKQQFSAYPNPTSGVVTFTYNVPDGGGDMEIIITNIVGETVKEIHTGNNRGDVIWNPGNLASGVYIYKASNKNVVISKGKLVVIK